MELGLDILRPYPTISDYVRRAARVSEAMVMLRLSNWSRGEFNTEFFPEMDAPLYEEGNYCTRFNHPGSVGCKKGHSCQNKHKCVFCSSSSHAGRAGTCPWKAAYDAEMRQFQEKFGISSIGDVQVLVSGFVSQMRTTSTRRQRQRFVPQQQQQQQPQRQSPKLEYVEAIALPSPLPTMKFAMMNAAHAALTEEQQEPKAAAGSSLRPTAVPFEMSSTAVSMVSSSVATSASPPTSASLNSASSSPSSPKKTAAELNTPPPDWSSVVRQGRDESAGYETYPLRSEDDILGDEPLSLKVDFSNKTGRLLGSSLNSSVYFGRLVIGPDESDEIEVAVKRWEVRDDDDEYDSSASPSDSNSNKKLQLRKEVRSIQKLFKETSHVVYVHHYLTVSYPQNTPTSQQYLLLVMEYCSFGNLEEYVKKLSPKQFTQELLRDFVFQLLQAYRACHKQRICHRDVKLTNILVANGPSGPILKLCDFSFSALLKSELQSMSTQVGTNHFVAPEVLAGGKYHMACDQWSLGVSLYYLMTRCSSYPYEKHHVTELKSLLKDKNFLSCAEAKEYPLLFDLISRMIVFDPTRRISSKDALFHPATWKGEAILRFISETFALADGKAIIHDIDETPSFQNKVLEEMVQASRKQPEFFSGPRNRMTSDSVMEVCRVLRNRHAHFTLKINCGLFENFRKREEFGQSVGKRLSSLVTGLFYRYYEYYSDVKYELLKNFIANPLFADS